VIDISAGFFYQAVVIISITVGLLEYMAAFSLQTGSDANISASFEIPAVIVYFVEVYKEGKSLIATVI
jgi:hypothetical protein